MDKIYVNGSIVSESGRHYAADFAAGGSIQDDYNGEVIEGDLVLTAQNTIKPYFEYEATGDIVASGIDDGDIYVVVPPTIVLNQFEKDLDDILMMTDVFLDNKVKQNLLYKMCYLNAVSAYEYFMGSFLVSVVLRDKYFFERYCSFFSKNVKPDDTYGHCSYSKISAPEVFTKEDVEYVVYTVRSFVSELMGRIRGSCTECRLFIAMS